jgi:hypothetical protein
MSSRSAVSASSSVVTLPAHTHGSVHRGGRAGATRHGSVRSSAPQAPTARAPCDQGCGADGAGCNAPHRPAAHQEAGGSRQSAAVKTLSARGTDPPFGDGVGVRRLHRCTDDLGTGRAPHVIERPGELGVPVTNQELARAGLLVEDGDQVASLLCNPPRSGVSGDAGQVHPSAGEFDDKQHIYTLENTVSTVRNRTPGSRRPAGAGTPASSLECAWAPGPDRGRAAPAGSSWPTPERQGAVTRRGCAGSPTADSREQAARPAAAPRRISQAVHGRWWGRSSAGRSCAGASAAASRVAPGTPTTAPEGAGGSTPRAAPGRWAAGGAVDAGGAAPQARGVTPGSRSLWPPPTESRAGPARGCGAALGRRTTRPHQTSAGEDE